jgi:hypothetical protein
LLGFGRGEDEYGGESPWIFHVIEAATAEWLCVQVLDALFAHQYTTPRARNRSGRGSAELAFFIDDNQIGVFLFQLTQKFSLCFLME